ncbi:MAG: serine/threonine protein kinase, partial [Myxococcales bacterium]|nr:serine/threonine protein kinase [Myxococcales bacterium]
MAPGNDGALLLGRYRLAYELGRGGAGIVYGAQDMTLGREVAVKVLQGRPRVPQAAARMAREAQALADVQHPHLVRLLDYGDEGGTPCLVMELVDGIDLRGLCAHHPCTVAETVVILDQTLAALQACHARGYVHRDLKPGNVLVQRGDAPLSVKIIDFGIVQIAGDAGATALTVQGQIFGSLRYMAPEQWSQVGVGPRTDLYAV